MNEERVVKLLENVFFHHDSSLLFFLFDVFFLHGFKGIKLLIIFFANEHNLSVGALTNNGKHMKLVKPGFVLIFHKANQQNNKISENFLDLNLFCLMNRLDLIG